MKLEFTANSRLITSRTTMIYRLVLFWCSLSVLIVNGQIVKRNKTISYDMMRWQKEILSFVKLNIRSCPYQTLKFNEFYDQINKKETEQAKYDSNNLKVFFRYPTWDEVQSYRKLPSTLSAANSKLFQILNAPRLIAWGKEEGNRWMIPPSHVGQNRTLCISLTKLLAAGNVVKLYDQYKIVQKASYLVVGNNALIHPQGFVMFECGSYQGIDGCGTRWEHELNNWYNPCKEIIRSSKLSWSEFLNRISKGNDRHWQTETSPAVSVQAMLEKCSFPDRDAVLQVITPPENYTMPIRGEKVMVITGSFDNNFHHMVSDSLVRFARYLNFLRRNPEVFIHMREFELTRPVVFTLYGDEVNMATKSRVSFFKLLGIDPSRIVHRTVIANTVYIPRETTCSYILRNPLELKQLSSQLIKSTKQWMKSRDKRDDKINFFSFDEFKTDKDSIIPRNVYYQADDTKYNNQKATKPKKNIVILHRQGKTSAWGRRMWTEHQAEVILSAFQNAFPDHIVIRHPSATVMHKDYCLACEISELMDADIMIGEHGAGMTKEMFMPPGGLVVELTGHFNDAQMPVCGYYGNIASIFGHHHYLYGYDHENGGKDDQGKEITEQLDIPDLVKKVKNYYDFLHTTESVTSAITVDKVQYPYT